MKPKRTFFNAVKWAYSASWGERAFSALFTFILAAILGPRDFGVVSIALIYVLFLQIFLDQGFVAALIQRKELDQEHLDAVFWMDLVLSLFLVMISVLLSGRWAAANHAPQLALLISVLSLCIPIEGLAVVQGALLRREMDFKSLSMRSNASVLIGGLVGIAMAFKGFGAWALVGQQIARDLSALCLLWSLSKWRPRFEFSWRHLRELMNFSISNFIAQLAVFADMQAGSILLGVLFGPVAVGLYRLADRFMGSVVAMATSSIQSVALPEFSRLQDHPEDLKKSALSCIRLSSIVTIPALAGLAAVSETLLLAVGNQWSPAVPVLKILCVMGMCLMLSFFTGPLLQALARTRELAVLEWVRVALGLGFLAVAGWLARGASVDRQILEIALARFVPVVFIFTPVFVFILMKLCGITLRELVASIANSVIASVCLVVAVRLFQATHWFAETTAIRLLLLNILVGGATGMAVMLLIDKEMRGFAQTTSRRVYGAVVASR
jgi:O-antigen/teichoic acid export membrane protein